MTRLFTVEVLPEALDDALAADSWYRAHSASAADAFLAEVERAVARITETPGRWPGYLTGTRRFLLRRFPFFVVYRLRSDLILIVAIAHARRRPGYWRGR